MERKVYSWAPGTESVQGDMSIVLTSPIPSLELHEVATLRAAESPRQEILKQYVERMAQELNAGRPVFLPDDVFDQKCETGTLYLPSA